MFRHMFVKLVVCCAIFVSLVSSRADAATVGLLDGSSVQSTFEGTVVGSGSGTVPAGWVAGVGDDNGLRTFLGGGAETNTALITADSGGLVQAQFDTGVSVVANTLYTLDAMIGTYQTTDSASSATLEIGTFSGAVFTPFTTFSPQVPGAGTGDLGSGAAPILQETFMTGGSVGTDTVGVRISVSATNFPGFDDVVLDAVTEATPTPAPEPHSLLLLSGMVGFVIAALPRFRRRVRS